MSHRFRTEFARYVEAATRALIVSAYKATCLTATTLSMMQMLSAGEDRPVPEAKKPGRAGSEVDPVKPVFREDPRRQLE